ncbi:hypothetical protein LPJ77_001638 [Coemansia sp. RSA 2523]|nr:hypothetical protein LPJ58_000789 [Coemansia sp. RSA 1591]KAJ1766655.1 hypothetical protein LPJ69_000783 [Coemansia sp. RSA 1752]KAJ1779114.1 hypothetical protein LPJ54_001186 [Coemansia sp. RSA 1824]KAJ1791534.1 hypothetical protein LPJ62_001343 [Coemansia sp. RSA 2167]KAJ1794446.1 hypothetical protein LPJ67_000745 [Coemansia sp. RSA 1938]KAJ1809449.1 hypothetical protein LPJ77_001638 [Coemansia sp. RSA 2523]KAJ2132681.1 hypothetical protein GGF48_000740 [Coemansia sp. RSA 921]KAJ2139739
MSSANYTQLPPSYDATSQPQQQPQGQAAGSTDDVPDDFKYGVSVGQSDLTIRHAFLRKVYAILALQMLVTTAVGGYMRHADATSGFLLRHVWTVYAAMFGSIAALIGVMWKRNSHPANAVFLSLFTLLEGYTLGAVTAFYSTSTVLQALAITLGLFVVLTLFTMQSRYDFSRMGPALFFMLCAVVLVGFVQIFLPFNRTFDLIMAVITALLFCGYILYDTHMIMNRLSPDEYIFASISLYLDVVNLFLAILRILGDQD